jgi:hypothetical protein
MNPEKSIRDILGEEAGSTFAFMCSNINHMIKALALADLTTPISEIQVQIQKAIQSAITMAVESFLRTEYPSVNGGMNVNIGDNVIYDQHMHVIKPFQILQEHQVEILSKMTEDYLNMFCTGRELAKNLAERNKTYISSHKYKPEISSVRDYALQPPLELKSIEIMRLERRMPNLSSDEKARLRDLYRKD